MQTDQPTLESVPMNYRSIKPSELKLVVITSCNCNLECNINIGVIYQCLQMSNFVRTVELESNVKGEAKLPKNKTNKKHKNEDKKKKHFINQITIVVNYSESKINIKLFGNGKMVLTGAKSVAVLQKAVSLLVEEIRSLSTTTQILETVELCDYFAGVGELVRFLDKNHLLILDLVKHLDLDFPLDWSKILVSQEKMRLVDGNKDLLAEWVTSRLFEGESETKLPEYYSTLIKLIQTVKFVKNYSYLCLNDKILNDALDFYRGKVTRIITSYESLPSEENIKVSVNNYNALFESNVKFDREKFHQVLTEKCGVMVNYRPSSYQGLNITYYLDYQGDREKVTFFVFQDGTVMITGNNKWEAIRQSYLEFCQIIDVNYDDIVNNETNSLIKKSTNPIKFEKVVDGCLKIYLNKEEVLIKNPRNFYILRGHSRGDTACPPEPPRQAD